MYKPSVDFVDKSNQNADKYETHSCEGKNHKGVNLLTDSQLAFSMRRYKKRLCWNCQRTEAVSER